MVYELMLMQVLNISHCYSCYTFWSKVGKSFVIVDGERLDWGYQIRGWGRRALLHFRGGWKMMIMGQMLIAGGQTVQNDIVASRSMVMIRQVSIVSSPS